MLNTKTTPGTIKPNTGIGYSLTQEWHESKVECERKRQSSVGWQNFKEVSNTGIQLPSKNSNVSGKVPGAIFHTWPQLEIEDMLKEEILLLRSRNATAKF